MHVYTLHMMQRTVNIQWHSKKVDSCTRLMPCHFLLETFIHMYVGPPLTFDLDCNLMFYRILYTSMTVFSSQLPEIN